MSAWPRRPRATQPGRLAVLRHRRLDGGRRGRRGRQALPHRRPRLERLDHAPRAQPCSARRRSRAPYWRGEGFWRDRRGTVTFPLEAGGWSAGEGKTYKPTSGITFAEGPSRAAALRARVAVDPGLIPLGSIVNVPAYKPVNGDGWFRADDTGGAIDGRHLDVFRRPPESADDPGSSLSDQRVYVVPAEDIAAYLRRQTLRPGRLPKVPERILTPGRLGRAP